MSAAVKCSNSTAYVPPHLRGTSLSSISSSISMPPYVTEALGEISSSDRIVITDIEGKNSIHNVLIDGHLAKALPTGCKIIFTGDLLDIDIDVSETGERVRNRPLLHIIMPHHIYKSIRSLRRILSMVIKARPKWFNSVVSKYYNRVKGLRFDDDGIPINFTSAIMAQQHFKQNLAYSIGWRSRRNQKNFYPVVDKQFQLFNNISGLKLTHLSKEEGDYYYCEVGSDDSCVFLVGNKELIFIHLIMDSSSITVEGDLINIHTDCMYGSTHFTDDLKLSVADANALFFYLSVCRIAFYENDVLYIHNGGVSNMCENIHRIIYDDELVTPTTVVCGHEKMNCAITKDDGINYFCMDNTRTSHSFNLSTGEKAEVTPDNTLMVVSSDGTVRMNLENPIISQDLYNKSVKKSMDFQFIGTSDVSQMYVPQYRLNNDTSIKFTHNQ